MRKFRGTGGAFAAASTVALLAAGADAKPLVAVTLGQTHTGRETLAPSYRNINPFYRNIGAFWGTVNPFYRNIGAFWGEIDPFYRNIGAFWGDINPMYRNIGAFNGEIYPEYRNIGAFWEQTGQRFTAIDRAWGEAGSYAANPAGYVAVRDQLAQLSASSALLWGDAVRSQTGKSFEEGFAKPLFAKFGIDLNDPASLETLPANERGHLFLDWYDGLMNFSGTDHVDWWMKTANWTPKLSQTQGQGKGAVIGLIDFFVAGDADIRSKTVFYEGVSNASNGHGAGVASLMVAAHDGKGVMGIAPKASIAAYNPFDATGTADWPDIKTGIVKVTGAGAHVINLSLGVPGWTFHPDWAAVFADSQVAAERFDTVYVVAAGNDGITQTQNVGWGKNSLLTPVKNALQGILTETQFIIVGSVDPTGTISDFSNRPGEACMTMNENSSTCRVRLKDRFIVAPGELILVSDDAGGVVRHSGTSFAAPLVSGAIALLHDRWPWLKYYPQETSDIILKSAKDLGAPGVDSVYGAGLLDVTASQAPLDFSKMTYIQVGGLLPIPLSASQVKSGGVKTSWASSGLYFTAFERVGATQRDFMIPLGSRLVGTKAFTGEYFQDYVYSRMVDWIAGGKFTDLQRATAIVPNGLGLNLSMTAGAANPQALRFSRTGRAIQSALRLDSPSGLLALTLGQGDGAIALGGDGGFAMFSDYEAGIGGVNPILGFASGGAYASATLRVTGRMTLSLGASEQRRARRLDVIGVNNVLDRAAFAGLEAYDAGATHVALDYGLSPAVTVRASYTSLRENGLLGIRSAAPGDIGGGARSKGVTLGASLALGEGVSLSASATAANTRTRGGLAALSTADGGLTSSAWQLALTKEELFGRKDRLRLSLAQPLTVERGAFDYSSVQVIDRETGAIGIVTQRVAAAGSRRFVAEGLYSLSLGERAELGAFGRGEAGDLAQGEARYTLGGRLKVQF